MWSLLKLGASLCASTLTSACSHPDTETNLTSPYEHGITFAVAPVLNFSGETNFDPIKAADLLASELTYIEGANVLPVSRVVAYLASQGKHQIESPAHCLRVAEAVGADAMWVAGITEYDPYTPVVGMAIQVYSPARESNVAFDAVAAERLAQPMTLAVMCDPTLPRQQIQIVYNGMHSNVADAVKHFAEPRSRNDSPLGWREYLKVQTLFLRFCWHDAIDRITTQERCRRLAHTTDNPTENPI